MRKHKYTMTEILVVVIIITILAGIILGTAHLVRNHNAEVKTRTMMKQIEFGLEECKRKFGYYPRSNGSDFEDLAMTRIYLDNDEPANTVPRKYSVAFKKACDVSSLDVRNGMLCDSWGTPLQYKSDGRTFTIFSKGFDGKDSVLDAASTDDLNNNDIIDVKEKVKDSDVFVVDLDNVYLD